MSAGNHWTDILIRQQATHWTVLHSPYFDSPRMDLTLFVLSPNKSKTIWQKNLNKIKFYQVGLQNILINSHKAVNLPFHSKIDFLKNFLDEQGLMTHTPALAPYTILCSRYLPSAWTEFPSAWTEWKILREPGSQPLPWLQHPAPAYRAQHRTDCIYWGVKPR